jgi:hypothetical protein
MSFLEDFLEIHKDAESPTNFFYWAGLAAISAVVRKNVYINKRIYKLYPNLYVMLVAKSGLRKGFPVKQSQKLVESLEVMKVISGQNSIQGIISELSKAWTSESGKVFRNAQAYVVNDELDSLLINDPSAQTILTTLYDSFYHKKWTKTLKNDSREVLDDLYITMLTATNPEHLDNFLDKTSILGGFLGRTIMIYEDKKARINPLIDIENISMINIEPLQEQLREISEIKGQFGFTKSAIQYYKEWYHDFYQKLEDGHIEDNTGTAERAGDSSLKISMLLALNENGPTLMIDQPHIEQAISLFAKASRSTKRIVEGKGKSEMSDKNRIVLEYLLSKDSLKASKKQILAAKYGDLDALELSRVMDTLSQAGVIVINQDPQEGTVYEIEPSYAERFKAKINQKLKS